MKIANLHPQEALRLDALHKLDVLDTQDEQAFDEITQLASELCETDISLVSLVDQKRQWFKSKVGTDASETSRDVAFCAHAILQQGVFEVENAAEDERFSDNPLVIQDPNIRFYAGAPLVTTTGMPIGTLCVIDPKPKKLTAQQLKTLNVLAKQVIGQLELRLKNKYLEQLNHRSSAALAILGKEVRSPATGISGLSKFMSHNADIMDKKQIVEISESILQASVHVYSIIDDLLLWCQLASDESKTKLVMTQPRNILENCIDLYSHDLESKHLSVENNIPSDLNVMADNNLLRSVVRNLLAITIRYGSNDGRIVVSGEIDEENPAQGQLTFRGMTLPERLKVALTEKLGALESDADISLSVCSDFLKDQKGQLSIETNSSGTETIQLGLLAQPQCQ